MFVLADFFTQKTSKPPPPHTIISGQPLLQNFALDGSLFDQGIRFDVREFKSVLVLKISDVELANVNSIGTLTYTKPVLDEPFMLENEIKMGVGRSPLGIKFRIFIAFKGLGEQLCKYLADAAT